PQEVEVGYGGGEDGGQAPPGEISIAFTDDLGRIAGYITWPDPASAWEDQPTSTWRTITATGGETIIRQLVNENCGPGARPERRIPRLILGPVAGVGTTTLVNTRFEGCWRRAGASRSTAAASASEPGRSAATSSLRCTSRATCPPRRASASVSAISGTCGRSCPRRR